MFDNSRDMVMAGWQYASQLECSIEQVGIFSSLLFLFNFQTVEYVMDVQILFFPHAFIYHTLK